MFILYDTGEILMPCQVLALSKIIFPSSPAPSHYTTEELFEVLQFHWPGRQISSLLVKVLASQTYGLGFKSRLVTKLVT